MAEFRQRGFAFNYDCLVVILKKLLANLLCVSRRIGIKIVIMIFHGKDIGFITSTVITQLTKEMAIGIN